MNKFTQSLICILLCILLFSTSTQAQSELEQGNKVITLGYGGPNFTRAGFVVRYDTYLFPEDYTFSGLGPISAKFEYMVMDKLGVGLSCNMVQGTLTTVGGTEVYSEKLTKYNALVRANFHFATTDRIDFYGGVGVGYNGALVNRTVTGGLFTVEMYEALGAIPHKPTYSPVTGEIGIGLRFFFTDNIGMYAEVGASKAIFQLGVSAKL